MTATLHLTTEGDLDPMCCGACEGPIGYASDGSAFVPYVLLPDPDLPEDGDGIGYDLDCAVRHCGVIIEVRG